MSDFRDKQRKIDEKNDIFDKEKDAIKLVSKVVKAFKSEAVGPDVKVFNDGDKLFSKPDPLTRMELPKDVTGGMLAKFFGKPNQQNYFFTYDGVPMKVNGFVVISYKDKLSYVKDFVASLLKTPLTEDVAITDRSAPHPNQANPFAKDAASTPAATEKDKEKKPEGKAKKVPEPEDELPNKTEIIINPDEKDID